jgi:hypothetical protein
MFTGVDQALCATSGARSASASPTPVYGAIVIRHEVRHERLALPSRQLLCDIAATQLDLQPTHSADEHARSACVPSGTR